MAKRIKLKQQDIVNIVENIVKEKYELTEDFSTSQNVFNYTGEAITTETQGNLVNPNGQDGIMLVVDSAGTVYAIDNRSGNILQKFD